SVLGCFGFCGTTGILGCFRFVLIVFVGHGCSPLADDSDSVIRPSNCESGKSGALWEMGNLWSKAVFLSQRLPAPRSEPKVLLDPTFNGALLRALWPCAAYVPPRPPSRASTLSAHPHGKRRGSASSTGATHDVRSLEENLGFSFFDALGLAADPLK